MSGTFNFLCDWSRKCSHSNQDILRFHVSEMPFHNKIIVFKAIVLKKVSMLNTSRLDSRNNKF